MENPIEMEVLIGKFLINGPLSSTPCLITGGYLLGNEQVAVLFQLIQHKFGIFYSYGDDT